MTAVEFLKKEYIKRGDCLPSGAFKDALDMEKKQIIDAANLKKEDRWYDAQLYDSCGEKYYAETYG
jgi:hypothetical protein